MAAWEGAQFPGKYSREHTWRFAGGAKLKASDSPLLTPEGYQDGAKLDPHKLFVATIASSHMLTWLHLALEIGIDVSKLLGFSARDHERA
jgi:organic hydroperoxide reductase OsmC/OhrA